MRNEHFEEVMEARTALLAAEAEHPGSVSLPVLHAVLWEIVKRWSQLLEAGQFTALSGGTKEPGQ